MYRRNADERIRNLERVAATGDPDAIKQLETEHFRLGNSPKNIDSDILNRRLGQWYQIVEDIEKYLVDAWNFQWNVLPSPRKELISLWQSNITEALGSSPVDTQKLNDVAYQFERYEEDLSDYFADELDFTGIVVDDQTLSELWEDLSGMILHHLRGCLRVYGDVPASRVLAWENLVRDNYSDQDVIADKAAWLACHTTPQLRLKPQSCRGRLSRRGPLFMRVISPRVRLETRLPFVGEWTYSMEDDHLSIYRGEWRGHKFVIKELVTNQWHVEIDDEHAIDPGELGDRWQDATRLIGAWMDEQVAWLYCSICEQPREHMDPCNICDKSTLMIIDDQVDEQAAFPEHVCHRCWFTEGELKQCCDKCAAICDRCNGVVCRGKWGCAVRCKKCAATLCDSVDCVIHCAGCDAPLCWSTCRNEGPYGSLCDECFAEHQASQE